MDSSWSSILSRSDRYICNVAQLLYCEEKKLEQRRRRSKGSIHLHCDDAITIVTCHLLSRLIAHLAALAVVHLLLFCFPADITRSCDFGRPAGTIPIFDERVSQSPDRSDFNHGMFHA
jgi:hypothetical protein